MRLDPSGQAPPKALLRFDGRSLLQRHLEILSEIAEMLSDRELRDQVMTLLNGVLDARGRVMLCSWARARGDGGGQPW